MGCEAQMKPLGEWFGRSWYWAASGSFTRPGLYYWDGRNNVRVFQWGRDNG